jgi:hypothetical protein
MYVYISELNKFNDFEDKNVLFWELKDIEYGDWTGGKNNDGIFEKNGQIQLTSVINTLLLTINRLFYLSIRSI